MVSVALDLADDIARQCEGWSADPYHDPVGYPTIGYGHLLSRKPYADLAQWKSISESEGEILLQGDMRAAEGVVDRLITVPLTDGQKAALIDFSFNCGGGNLQASTLRRVINRGEYYAAPAQFKKWVYARKRKLRGLIIRRQLEIDHWIS